MFLALFIIVRAVAEISPSLIIRKVRSSGFVVDETSCVSGELENSLLLLPRLLPPSNCPFVILVFFLFVFLGFVFCFFFCVFCFVLGVAVLGTKPSYDGRSVPLKIPNTVHF